jgi:hypothetical protein
MNAAYVGKVDLVTKGGCGLRRNCVSRSELKDKKPKHGEGEKYQLLIT